MDQQNREQANSNFALKIVFFLSFILVIMDTSEVVYSYKQLKSASIELNINEFESCYKYHIISQIFFTTFATLAGLSACIMSFGLIINFNFFQNIALSTFLFWNYLLFGPVLLGSVLVGLYNWNEVFYYCSSKNSTVKYFNFSTLMAVLICLIFSGLISIGYAIWNSINKVIQSVRFHEDGNEVVGRLFWDYVMHRRMSNDDNQSNIEIPIINNEENNLINDSHIQNENNQSSHLENAFYFINDAHIGRNNMNENQVDNRGNNLNENLLS